MVFRFDGTGSRPHRHPVLLRRHLDHLRRRRSAQPTSTSTARARATSARSGESRDSPAGPHTLRLTATSRRNPSSSGGNAYVDAFDVSGTLIPARFEQNDPLISYAGPWTTTNSPSLSGGSLCLPAPRTRRCPSPSTAGPSTWWAPRAPTAASPRSRSTAATATDADFYGPATAHKQRIWSAGGLDARDVTRSRSRSRTAGTRPRSAATPTSTRSTWRGRSWSRALECWRARHNARQTGMAKGPEPIRSTSTNRKRPLLVTRGGRSCRCARP